MTNLVGELVGCGPSKQIWNGIDLPEEEEEEEPRKKKKSWKRKIGHWGNLEVITAVLVDNKGSKKRGEEGRKEESNLFLTLARGRCRYWRRDVMTAPFLPLLAAAINCARLRPSHPHAYTLTHRLAHTHTDRRWTEKAASQLAQELQQQPGKQVASPQRKRTGWDPGGLMPRVAVS